MRLTPSLRLMNYIHDTNYTSNIEVDVIMLSKILKEEDCNYCNYCKYHSTVSDMLIYILKIYN